MVRRIIILGAAGRDFHNFLTFYRGNPNYEVVAFTCTQIPGIGHRLFPPELAGPRYPKGIPIHLESELERLVKQLKPDEAVLAYSDLSHEQVGHMAARCLALGLDFTMLGPNATMLRPRKPVVSVCAVRTGSGKSTVAQAVAALAHKAGLKPVVIRHPMPYGDLAKSALQRFATLKDLDRAKITMEEREEYEPHITAGNIVYAGVDYARILHKAESEANLIIWDGGNNDLPFIKPDLHIVLADGLRPGAELGAYPGEANVRLADIIAITKADVAKPADIALIRKNVKMLNPRAKVVQLYAEFGVDKPKLVKGKRVLVVEDAPTITHGGLPSAAGLSATLASGGRPVGPRPYAKGTVRRILAQFPHIKVALPALGYTAVELRDLERSINATPADVVVAGSGVAIERLMKLNKPVAHVQLKIREQGEPSFTKLIKDWLSTISK